MGVQPYANVSGREMSKPCVHANVAVGRELEPCTRDSVAVGGAPESCTSTAGSAARILLMSPYCRKGLRATGVMVHAGTIITHRRGKPDGTSVLFLVA
jgi:hypothetical protein